MKKLAKILALLFAIVIIATGCKKLPEFTDGSGSTPNPVTPVLDEPTVITEAVVSVGTTDAVCGGSVEYSGYYELTAVGFCWSEKDEPTIEDHYSVEATSAGSFVGKINNLSPNTTYYVRMYATNANGTYYGNVLEFTTLESGGGEAPTGAINGLFSVSNTKQVYFSKGNLQYQASMDKWRFAENQWDYVGEENSNISSYYEGWIDLFGWGTSGYNHGAVCYQPWSTNTDDEKYFAYGNYNNNLSDQTGQADWGYNPISNGGNSFRLWRTLTKDEWYYLLNSRNTPSNMRYARATVNGVKGIILIPDNWDSSIFDIHEPNILGAPSSVNTISQSDWTIILEVNGVVFLPAASYRDDTNVFPAVLYGAYWTGTYSNGSQAHLLMFDNAALGSEYYTERHKGLSVRLVHDAE